MAYNIIKGRVEFSNSSTGSVESLVDIWRDQAIGGVKTFSSTVSASAFWDTTAEGEVRALKSLIAGDGADRVITSDGDGTLTAESNVTITTAASVTSLGVTGHITGSTFSGSAHGLTGIILNPDHLAATNYDGMANRLSASNIVLGLGISSSIDPAGLGHGAELQVTGGQGITVDTEGVRVLTASNGGLAFTGQTLQVDASKTTNKGGGPSNNDQFIIADSGDSDTIKNLTYTQIKTAITDSIAAAAISSYTNSGNNRIITSVNSSTVNGEANLTFDGSLLSVSSSMRVSGAAHVPTLSVLPGGASFGKVGINVSEPGVQLQVGNNTGAAILGLHRTSSAFYIDGDDIGDLVFVGSAAESVLNISSRIRVEADGSEWNNESYPTRMSFWTTLTGTSTPVQHMVINNSGNVGIGITGSAPNSKLHLSGNLTIQETTPTLHFSSSAGEDLAEFGVNSSDNILIQNNSTNKHIVFKTNDAGTMKEGFRIDGAVPEVVVNQGSDSLIDFRVESNNNTHMLMVDGSGDKVGINASVPTHTLTVIGDASVSGEISGSGGVHITGSSPRLAIGDKGGTAFNDGMLFIRPSDTSNRVLTLMQAREADGNRICFGVTGSGQVLVGGAHFGGILNVSGSDAETLISVKSDSTNPALSLTGVGDLFVARGAYLSGAVQHNYVVKTTSADTYISGATDRVAIYNLTSPHNAYLPLLSDTLNGVTITVKCVGSANITVTGSGPSNQLIDQAANKVLETGDSMTVMGYNGPAGYQWAILDYYNAS
jgi:hypothetical protein